MNIREYREEDREQIEDLIAILQDFEAKFVSGLKPGKEMASRYLTEAILKDCEMKEGKIYVAIQDEIIVGFIWCWVQDELRDLTYLKPVYKYLWIGDFVVLDEYRSKGYGKSLMEKAEEYGREKQVDGVKLTTNPKNELAREIYKKLDFEEEEIVLIKKL
jgi:ribosomal protein S18 acetylase RimI-like enzyme